MLNLASARVTLTDSTVNNNQNITTGTRFGLRPGRGGGLENLGVLTLIRTTVRDNSAGIGGGISSGDSATLTVSDSTLSGNRALSCEICDEDDQGVTDRGARGGGIFATGSATLVNTTVSGNTADIDGGGVIGSAGLILRNVTVTGNIADNDQNGTGAGGGISGSLTIGNSLIAGNTDRSGQAPDCMGAPVSQGYNLIGRTQGCTIGGTLTGNLLGVDAVLGPLANNGGSTATHALLPGSPAIDTGNPAAPGSSATACPTTDQRGTTRPQGFADTARCDISALERVGDANLLLNGSFEQDTNSDGTPDGWSANARVSRSSTVVRSGS